MKSFVSRALPLVLLAVLAAPSVASGQATRTWISGVGDDVNPCSRTAPCKTWAGAMPKTAAGGEINALDRGGFGTLTGAGTINKSITLVGDQRATSNLSASTMGALIQAGANDRIVLRNININGHGTGTDGIRIISAGSVRVEESRIHGFNNGIQFAPTGGTTKVTVQDSSLYNNRNAGVNLLPVTASLANPAIARITIRRSDIDDNLNGVVANGTNGRAAVTMSRSEITDSGTAGGPAGTGVAVKASGTNGLVRLTNSEIFGNLAGLVAETSGQILSGGDNSVFANNNADGAPTGTFGKM